jgi:hypothetical protein
MNTKATLISLILIASLHGQASQNDQVTISAGRLATLNGQHIQFMAQNGLISFKGDKAILSMNKMDDLLERYENEGRIEEALKIRSRMVPYGCT